MLRVVVSDGARAGQLMDVLASARGLVGDRAVAGPAVRLGDLEAGLARLPTAARSVDQMREVPAFGARAAVDDVAQLQARRDRVGLELGVEARALPDGVHPRLD